MKNERVFVQSVEGAKQFKWTKRKPTKIGWYFYRDLSYDESFFDILYISPLTRSKLVRLKDAQWAGPIDAPGE